MTTTHHVAIFSGSIIGDAATKIDAIRICQEAGYSVIPENAGGNVDFYDAEDGPAVQGYEPDGKGVWIIACE